VATANAVEVKMFLIFLTILDFLGLIIILLSLFGIYTQLLLVVAAYLILKGLIFWGDFTSILDMLSGFYLILLFFGVHSVFTYIIMFYLSQKIIFAFLR